MSFHRNAASLFLMVLVATVAFTATAGAATVLSGSGGSATQQWDAPDYSSLSVKQTTPPIETSDLLELLETSFAEVDTDGDGQVSFAEAEAALPGLTQAAFDAADTNGDGQISKDEAGIGSGCNCNGIDFSDPSAIVIAIISFLGLIVGYRLCGC